MMFVFVFPLRSGTKSEERDTFRGDHRPSSRFIFTDYRTLDDCKLECNSSSARPWISHRYRVLRCPPLIHSVLTSVVLPVSAFVELFRWPIARIFSITILLSFYESASPCVVPLLTRWPVIGFAIRSESRFGLGLRENKT